MARKLTDEQFIAMWRQYQSATDMAKALDMNLRGIFMRRVNIEKRHGIALPVATRLKNARTAGNADLVMAARRDVNRVTIDSGVMIVGSDAHYTPGHVSVAHKAMCNLLSELGTEVKAVVLNGDILDGGSIGRHGRIQWQQKISVKDELEAVQERLGDIEKIRPAGCHLLRTYGNHCARFETKLSNMVPEYEGIGGFLLRDHLPHWKDSLRIDVNEDTVIIHDWHSGVHSGWNDVVKGGCHTVTGHTHELSAKAHKGFKGTHYGIKTGMLADEEQPQFDYKMAKPGFNWQSGFAVLTWEDGILLHPEFCAVRDNGKAYFRGEMYAD